MSKLTIPPNRPFSVTHFPFFYGWVIWLVATVGYVMSIPGQTMGMAVFTDYFIDTFELSRTQLSVAYLFGTLTSSLILVKAGSFYDKTGARLCIVASSLGLGLCVVFIASIDLIANTFVALSNASMATFSFPLILLGYFGVRFMGQGVMANATRNVLLLWFDKKRGLVSGVHSTCVTLCFALAPAFLAFLISLQGWRVALFTMAAIVGVAFSLIAACLVRDSPESCGLSPDGNLSDEAISGSTRPDVTAAQARKSPVFWIYLLTISFFSLFSTAMTFHIVSIFTAAGRTPSNAFSYFVPMAIIAVATNLLVSWLSDSIAMKPFLIIKLTAFICGTYGLLNLDHEYGYCITVIGFGITTGIWGALNTLVFVRFFGRLYLGEISGINAAFSVFGSAIGPAFFSVVYDQFGSYGPAMLLSIAVLSLLLLTAIAIPQPEPIRVSA